MKSCLALFLAISVSSTAHAAPAAPLVSSPLRQNLDIALNVQRTQVTMILFTQIIADLMAHGKSEKDSWLHKVAAKINSSYDPEKTFEENRACVETAMNKWASLIENGQVGTTREAVYTVLYDTSIKKSCLEFFDTLAGQKSLSFPHGQFLSQLQNSELDFDLRKRKLQNLTALSQLISGSGNNFLAAGAGITTYYFDDKDPVVSDLAKRMLKTLPTLAKSRNVLNLVKPDNMIVPAFLTLAGVRLLTTLPYAYKLKGAALTLGIHIGIVTQASNPSDSNKAFINEGDVRARIHFNESEKALALRSMKQMVAPFKTDHFANKDFNQVVIRKLELFLRLKQDDLDFAPYFVNSENNVVPHLNPLNYNKLVDTLDIFSHQLSPLAKSSGADQQAKSAQIRKRLYQTAPYQRFARAQSTLSRYIGNEGGNFFAQTQLAIATLWPLREALGPDWVLGVQMFSDRSAPVLYNKKEKQLIDLVAGLWTIEIKAPVFHPYFFLNAYLVNQKLPAAPWEMFLLAGEIPKPDQQRSGNSSDSEPNVPQELPRGNKKYQEKSPPASGSLNMEDLEKILPKNALGKRSDVDPLISSEDFLEDGTKECAERKLFSPDLPPDEGKAWLLQQAEDFGFHIHQKCYGKNNKLLGYILLLHTTRDHKALESLSSDSARADYLLEMVHKVIQSRMNQLLVFKKVLLNPKVAMPKPAYLDDDIDDAFSNVGLIKALTAIQELKHSRLISIEDQERKSQSPLVALSFHAFSSLIEAQLEILKMLANRPEAVVRLIDDPSVPAINKNRVSGLYYDTISDLPKPSDTKIEELAEVSKLMNAAFMALDYIVSNPRILAISEPLRDKSESTEIDFAPPAATEARPNVVFSDKVKGPSCSGKVESERCRKQKLTYINLYPAKHYVSPLAFITLVEMISGTENPRPSAIGNRWSGELEALMLQIHVSTLTEDLRRYELDKDATGSAPFFNLNGLPQQLATHYKNQPWRIKEVDDIDLAVVPITPAPTVIPTSKLLYDVHSCQKDRDKKALDMASTFNYHLEAREPTPAEVDRAIRSILPFYATYLKCAARLVK